METWKDIPGYTGYQASTEGRIRSVDRTIAFIVNGKMRTTRLPGKILSPLKGRGKSLGYLKVKPSGRQEWIHSLVCITFHGDRPKGKTASHIDESRENNRADNLKWATAKEQTSGPMYRMRTQAANARKRKTAK